MDVSNEILAGVIAIGGGMATALGYVGKTLIGAMTMQLESQQQTLMQHTQALTELVSTHRSFEERVCESHRIQCECLSRIAEALIALGANGNLKAQINEAQARKRT